MIGRRQVFTFSHELEEEGALNLTPLIDVVFVVLILFILVAPFLEFDRISLASGGEVSEQNSVSIQPLSLTIQVFADNTIWVNKMRVFSGELTDVMKQHRRDLPSSIPQIYLDKQVFFGTYQVLKNALETAGFEQMDVILTPGKADAILEESGSE